MADIFAYFSGGRTVTVQREGYAEPVAIPACPRVAVEAAVSDAVRQGVLWLVNGPASFQGEPAPPGVLTDAAELRAPMQPLSVDRLTTDVVPEAWKDGQTSALALSSALSVQTGAPLPWPILRRVIDDALSARWLALAEGSAPWPCDAAGLAAVTLAEPAAAMTRIVDPKSDFASIPEGAHTGSADLEPNELQDLIDVLPNVIAAAAGVPLRLHIRITLGDGNDVPPDSVSSVNQLLEGVSSVLRLTK